MGKYVSAAVKIHTRGRWWKTENQQIVALAGYIYIICIAKRILTSFIRVTYSWHLGDKSVRYGFLQIQLHKWCALLILLIAYEERVLWTWLLHWSVQVVIQLWQPHVHIICMFVCLCARAFVCAHILHCTLHTHSPYYILITCTCITIMHTVA